MTTHTMSAAGASSADVPHGFSRIRLSRMVRKEIKQLLRDKLSRPLLLAAPIIQMTLLGYAATTDVTDIKTAVVDQDRSAASRALLEAYEASGYFRVVERAGSVETLGDALGRGRVVVGLTIPPGFARDLHDRGGATIQALVDGSDASTATLAQSYAVQVAAAFGAHVVSERRAATGVELRSRAWFNPSLTSRYFNVPAIMGILMMLVCLLLTALSVVREREIGTLDQLLVSPIKPAEMIVGKTIPVLCLGVVHLLLFVSLAVFHFGVPFQGSFWSLFLAAILYIASGLALGLLISTVSRTQQEAFMLLILFFLPAVMLSGFISPVEGMPVVFRWLNAVNPLRYFLEIVRGVFLKGTGLAELWRQYVVLAAMAGATLFLSTRRFKSFVT